MARKAILLITLLITPMAWTAEDASPTLVDDDEESSLWTETPESESKSCVAACIANGEAAIDCEESCVQIAGLNPARGSRLCRSARPGLVALKAAL